jgi:hypothetical protein
LLQAVAARFRSGHAFRRADQRLFSTGLEPLRDDANVGNSRNNRLPPPNEEFGYMRKLLAALAACGLILSFVAYMKSLSGTTSNELWWIPALIIGALALHIPIPFLEHAWEDRTFFWKGFVRGLPHWAVPCITLFWLVAVAHLVWFFVRSDAAIPIIKDGQYILESHGRIRRVLTQPEYLTLKTGELRALAALMFAVYLQPLLYWWFPRRRAAVVPSPPLSS